MGWNIHQTERRDQLLLMEIPLYTATRTLKGLFFLIVFTEHYGSGQGHGTRPSSSGGDGSDGHSEETSNEELGRLGPALSGPLSPRHPASLFVLTEDRGRSLGCHLETSPGVAGSRVPGERGVGCGCRTVPVPSSKLQTLLFPYFSQT